MNVAKAKSIPLSLLLKHLGFNIVNTKKEGKELWYLSPFRKEKTASFHVNSRKNIWYDFGLGRGGNILDFVMTYYNQNLSQALNTMERLFAGEEKKDLVSPVKDFSGGQVSDQEAMSVKKILPLNHQALRSYLNQRCVPLAVACHYLQQVHFTVNHKTYFALGFENDQGGWELRNKYFQGATSPKSITVLRGEEPDTYLRVFEGFMDFLSYLTIKKDTYFQGTVVVLNSLALFSKLEEHLADNTYKAVIAFFDNDDAGQEAYKRLVQTTPLPLYDRSSFYQGYKDLNAYLVARE